MPERNEAYLQGTKPAVEGNPSRAKDEASQQQSAKIPQKSTQQQVQLPKPEYAIFVFPSVRDIMKYAAALPANLRIDSELYQMEGKYYLYLKKGKASYQRFSKACVQALEFASLYSAEETVLICLKEHGECLIAEKAVKKLRT